MIVPTHSLLPASMTAVTYSVADVLRLPHDAGSRADAERAGDRESVEVRALLDRATAGDQHAFGRLIDMHQRVVYRTALAALGRPEDAEDAAQDAFIQAWRNLPGFRGDATFRTWLLTIAWRKALDRRRSRLLWWKRASTGTADDQELFADIAGGAVAGVRPNRVSLDPTSRALDRSNQRGSQLADPIPPKANDGSHGGRQ